jgi:ankyrin repeat protein
MGCTALMRAARQDDVATVHALLREGVDVQARDREGRTAFMAAVAQGSASVVPRLLQAGVSTQERDREGRTVLMTAATQGHAAIVSLLLQAGADVQAPDAAGRTALMHVHSASRYPETQGATATVRTLLAAGANVQAPDQQGRTALMYAARQGATTTVHTLLAAGANVQASDQQGRTALMYAARNYVTSEDTVRTLLQAGADVHSRDQEGRTALMYAAREGAAATARVLLQAGADVHARDRRRRTAWVHASTIEQTHPGLLQVLREFGARDPGLKRAVGRLRPRSLVAVDPGHADGWEMVPRDVDNAWKYPQPGACTSFSVSFDRRHTGSLRLCVPAVVVYDSGDMEFHVTWRGEQVPSGYEIRKESDVGNRNMYVLDNLGNRYDHIALDGAARDRGSVGQGMELSGAFLFPPAQPGAFRFQFVDANQGVAILNIELRPLAL